MRVSVVAGLILGVHVAVIGSVAMTQGCASSKGGAVSTEPAAVESAPAPQMPPSAAVVAQPAVQPVAFPQIQPPLQPAPLKTSVAAENVYVVKSGDSLSKIAAAHGVKTKDLMAANNISDANKIRAGQKLVIPGAKAAAAKPEEKPAEAAKVEAQPAEQPKAVEPAAAPAVAPLPAPVPEAAPAAAVAAPAAAPAPESQDAMLDYPVQDGATAEGIARLFVVNKDDILRVNNIPAGSDVKAGQKIKIPPSTL